jgi:hypothetical protein
MTNLSNSPTSATTRDDLVEAVTLDLVGPDNAHRFAKELLPKSPRSWYLTGFLVPRHADAEQRKAEDGELEEEAEASQGDDNQGTGEQIQASLLPSSIGLTVMVPPGVKALHAVARWGDYFWEAPADEKKPEPEEQKVNDEFESEFAKEEEEKTGDANKGTGQPFPMQGYRRDPREESAPIELKEAEGRKEVPIPNSGGLLFVVSWEELNSLGNHGIPAGTKTVSVFLVNDRRPKGRLTFHEMIFQAELELKCESGFFGRPDLRGATLGLESDADDRIADLHYRDALEYGVGHGVSAESTADEDGVHRTAKTNFLPTHQVPRMEHAGADTVGNVELGMEALGELRDGDDAKSKLQGLVTSYRDWIEAQRSQVKSEGLPQAQLDTALELLNRAFYAADRIEDGVNSLADAKCLEAFRIANRAMAAAARQRSGIQTGADPKSVDAPKWRAFQLAFILMNLRGLLDPAHPERGLVDLLFFPTGGGKTEAYLGLSAFTLVLRRLTNPGISSAGVSIIMRYTLRLLTLDQLGRAAALICALELEREKDSQKLGEWPFEIGLWVGSASTPNRMGRANDNSPGADNTAYNKLMRFKRNPDKHPAPIPLEECPWCGTRFEPDSFQLDPPASTTPRNLHVACMNTACLFSSAVGKRLPILGVDEPIYRRLPCFLIATIDKFAALPWTGRVGALFGRVERYKANHGFYGPCDPAEGTPLPDKCLLPPDLIIQDELHLISGPLGTVAGLYETVIEQLCRRTADREAVIVPKVVASTATVRQASRQIRALFGREQVAIFPPPGPDRRDSFFARVVPVSELDPGRLYMGIAATGRSMKVVFLKACLALLSGAESLYQAAGGAGAAKNAADPYMTLLAYFNSLRELGGCRRLIEEQVTASLQVYWKRKRRDPLDNLFRSRVISRTPLELTSRVDTNDIAQAKRALALSFAQEGHTDVALATNMISVGLDIIRLGLMLVFGQPKTTSEYIQATSRVGRDPSKPGLVVVLLNPHKPRDRSHYERFDHYHETFYRAVEATSVTPFSSGALDRGLAGALVGLCRHMLRQMEPYCGAGEVRAKHAELAAIAKVFGQKAEIHDATLVGTAEAQELANSVHDRVQALLADWNEIATDQARAGVDLNYQRFEENGNTSVLLRDFLDPDLKRRPEIFHRFRANRSMRDVEAPVDILPTASLRGTH